MTVDEAPTIGTRLALGHGVSNVVAMLEPELTALDRTVSSSSTMLKTMMQLGGRLNPFNANLAPIVVPSPVRQSAEVSMEPPGTNAPELAVTRTASRPTARDVPVSRSQPHGATRTHQVRLSPLGDLYPGGLVSQDTPTSPQGQPVQIATSSKNHRQQNGWPCLLPVGRSRHSLLVQQQCKLLHHLQAHYHRTAQPRSLRLRLRPRFRHHFHRRFHQHFYHPFRDRLGQLFCHRLRHPFGQRPLLLPSHHYKYPTNHKVQRRI